MTPRGWFVGLLYKLVWLLYARVSYFFITSMTALIVRVLTSSGVAVMFPVIWCMRRVGLADRGSERVLEFSYPWLGMPIRTWDGDGEFF